MQACRALLIIPFCLFGACQREAAEALVVVDVAVAQDVSAFTRLRLSVPRVPAATRELAATGDTRVGLYVPAATALELVAQAIGARDCVVAEGKRLVPPARGGQTVMLGRLELERRDGCAAPAAMSGDGGVAETAPPARDDQPPTIVAIVPADGSKDVDRAGAVVITFSEPIAPDSATAAAVTVTADGQTVAGRLAADDAARTVTFTPTMRLPMLANVVVKVGAGLRDRAGNPLAAERQSGFATADGAWTKPEVLQEHDNGPLAGGPLAVAASARGDAIAVWSRAVPVVENDVGGGPQRQDTRNVLHASRFAIDEGWGQAQQIAPAAFHSVDVSVAMDDEGRGTVVWNEEVASAVVTARRPPSVIAHARFEPSSGWRAPERLASGVPEEMSRAFAPRLALGARGNGMLVYQWQDRTSHVIRGLRRALGVFIGPTADVHAFGPADLPMGVFTFAPDVAVDGSGNAVAVWGFSSNVLHRFTLGQFSPVAGWGAPRVFSAANQPARQTPRVAMDDKGNAIVSWFQRGLTLIDPLQYVRYDAAKNLWSTPALAGEGADNVQVLDVQPNGAGLLAWSSLRDVRFLRLRSGEVVGQGALSLGQVGTSEESMFVLDAAGGVDAGGRVTMLVTNLARDLYAVRELAGRVLPAVKLSAADVDGPVHVEVLPDGRAHAIWIEGAKPHRLMAARFF